MVSFNWISLQERATLWSNSRRKLRSWHSRPKKKRWIKSLVTKMRSFFSLDQGKKAGAELMNEMKKKGICRRRRAGFQLSVFGLRGVKVFMV